MTKPLKNVGASVRARLLHLAKQRGDDFQLVLLRYANERLLYRLATSGHAEPDPIWWTDGLTVLRQRLRDV